jgi:hypothetical protein
MTKRIALIDQARGLGDIFFLQKAVYEISERMDNIIWPIHPKYNYLHEYLITPKTSYFSFPLNEAEFSESVKIWHKVLYDNYKSNTFSSTPVSGGVIHYYPFRTSSFNSNDIDIMYSKYKILNISFDDWQKYFQFKRKLDREDSLRKKYGIERGEKFIFVNTMYFTSPYNTYKINLESEYKIIYNDGSPCHIFDFCWLLENAQEIHTVETSMCYLVEVLNTTDKIYCYPRLRKGGEKMYQNFDYINKIFKKNWNYIQ